MYSFNNQKVSKIKKCKIIYILKLTVKTDNVT